MGARYKVGMCVHGYREYRQGVPAQRQGVLNLRPLFLTYYDLTTHLKRLHRSTHRAPFNPPVYIPIHLCGGLWSAANSLGASSWGG